MAQCALVLHRHKGAGRMPDPARVDRCLLSVNYLLLAVRDALIQLARRLFLVEGMSIV